MGGFVGTLVAGGAAADIMGAVPIKDPATGAKTTADGKPVAASSGTGRDHLNLSALIIGGALAALLFGSRALRDARIA